MQDAAIEIKATDTFAGVLRDEFERRRDRNGRYSLRAFARDIELSPSRLSELMNGKHTPSRATVRAISQKFRFSKQKTEKLCDVVDALHASCEHRRAAAARRLTSFEGDQEYFEFSDDAFRMIADWYHLAIMTLCETEGFKGEGAWIAKRLKISEEIATNALTRLERLGLLVEDENGEWKPLHSNTVIPDEKSAAAQRIFHEQLLNRALRAMNEEDRSRRHLGAMVFPAGPDAYLEIRDALTKFQDEVSSIKQKYADRSEVYAVSMQLTQLSYSEVANREVSSKTT